MKISEVLDIFTKVSKILELYDDVSFSKVLDKIYSDLKEYKKSNSLDEVEKKHLNMDFNQLVDNIKKKEKQENINELEKYSKSDLIEFSKLLNIKGVTNFTKFQLVMEIINHFEYSKLNDMMADRNSNNNI